MISYQTMINYQEKHAQSTQINYIILFTIIYILYCNSNLVMASKQPLKLFDIQSFLIKQTYKLTRFIKHNLFMQKYKVLIIGKTNNNNFQHIYKHINMHKLTFISNHHQNIHPEDKINQKFSQVIINHSYKEIQKKLDDQKFDSIVVLNQEDNKDLLFNIQDQDFAIKYPNVHYKEIMMNVLAYRLAHKYLSNLGTVILTCNENQFIKYKAKSKNSSPSSYPLDNLIENKDSSRIMDSLIAYLGVVIGQRQHTNLNSNCVIFLKSKAFSQNSQLIGKYYGKWINGIDLPHAGSFALLRPKQAQKNDIYIEYL